MKQIIGKIGGLMGISLFLGFCFFSTSVVIAQTQEKESCSPFTETQTQSIQKVQDFLDRNQDAIAGLFEQDYDLQMYIVNHISDMIRHTYGALYCYDETIATYEQYQQRLTDLVQKIVIARKNIGFFTETTSTENNTSIVMLQKHLAQALQLGVDATKPFSQQANMKIEGFFTDPDTQDYVSGSVSITSSGEYDFVSQGKFTSRIQIRADAYIVPYNQDPIQGQGHIDIELRKADNMFVRIHDMDFSLDPVDTIIAQEYSMFKTITQSILQSTKGQYIILDGDMNFSVQQLFQAFSLMQGVTKQSLIQFTHTQDGKQWGVFTPYVCDVLPMSSYECMSTIYDLMLSSKARGYLILSQNNGQNVLTFDPTYMTQPQKQNLQKIRIQWTSDAISYIYIPLGDNAQGYIVYENSNRKGQYADEEGSFKLSTQQKDASTKTIIATIDMKDDNSRIEISWDYQPGKITNNHMYITLTVMQDGKKIVSGSMKYEQVVNYLQAIQVTQPTNFTYLEKLISTLGMSR